MEAAVEKKMDVTDEVMTEAQAAEFMKIKRITISTWRRKGSGPPYVKTGHNVRYLKASILRWLREQELEI